MAKRVKKKKQKLARRPVSRVEREQRQRRYIIIGTVVVAVLVGVLILLAVYQGQVVEPRAERARQTDTVEAILAAQTATAQVVQATWTAAEEIPIATVYGEVISLADWQARVRYERRLIIEDIGLYQNQIDSMDTSTDMGQQLKQFFEAEIQTMRNELKLGTTLAGDVLENMVEEVLIRQEAQRQGITVTPQRVQDYIEVVVFNYPYPPTPTPDPRPTATLVPGITPAPTVTPTVTPPPASREEFDAYYQSVLADLASLNLTEERWENVFEAMLYRQELLDLYAQEVEPVQLQVQIDYISTPDQDQAQALLARLEAGEPFADLMQEIEADEVVTITADSRDWSPVGELSNAFGLDFEKATFNTSPGNFVSEVIMGSGGEFYLIYVVDAEERALSPEAMERQATARLETWLGQAKASDEVTYGDWQSFVPMEPSLPE